MSLIGDGSRTADVQDIEPVVNMDQAEGLLGRKMAGDERARIDVPQSDRARIEIREVVTSIADASDGDNRPAVRE